MGWVIDHPWAPILLVATVLFTFWAVGTRSSDNEIKAVFTEAASVYSGLDVRVDGIDAGKVQGVEHENGHAVLTLGIDNDVWPLREGATATLRYGSTVGNGTRIIDVERGPANGKKLTEDDVITNDKTIETTEFDDVFDTFSADTRADVQGMSRGLSKTFGSRVDELRSAVKETGPGLSAVGGLAAELVRDRPALTALVANTNRVTRTLAARRSQIEDFVTVSAATFDTFARNNRNIVRSLDRFPTALQQMRSTLARTDQSLVGLDALTDDLRPGAERLAPLARAMRPALAELRRTVPDALQTFRVAQQTAPQITTLLERAQPFSAAAQPVFERLAPMLECIAPYAPEIAGLNSTWASWSKNHDNETHYGRVFANFGQASVTSTPELDTETFTGATLQKYALVRPPGFNGGNPTFKPECNQGTNGLDVKNDPEDED